MRKDVFVLIHSEPKNPSVFIILKIGGTLRPNAALIITKYRFLRSLHRQRKTGKTEGFVRGGRIGWGGRIRTYTVRINSAVSYQLDHAPADAKRYVESISGAG